MTIAVTIHTSDKAAKVVTSTSYKGEQGTADQTNHVEPNSVGTFHVTDTRTIAISEVEAEG